MCTNIVCFLNRPYLKGGRTKQRTRQLIGWQRYSQRQFQKLPVKPVRSAQRWRPSSYLKGRCQSTHMLCVVRDALKVVRSMSHKTREDEVVRGDGKGRNFLASCYKGMALMTLTSMAELIPRLARRCAGVRCIPWFNTSGKRSLLDSCIASLVSEQLWRKDNFKR